MAANSLTFWMNVNALIKNKRITQDILCQQTGISINTLKGWISKEILPRVDEAVKIAQALNVSVEYLVTSRETLTLYPELPEYEKLDAKHRYAVQEFVKYQYSTQPASESL